MLRGARAAAYVAGLAALVEWQEAGAFPGEAGRHVHLVGIRCEVHQSPPAEPEQRSFGVAAVFVPEVPLFSEGWGDPTLAERVDELLGETGFGS